GVRLMATVRVDLAIGRDGVTAILPPDGEICRVAARIDPLSDEIGPALEEAIAGLEERVRGTLDSAAMSAGRMRVCVVLLPPLSEGRVVEMPPLRPEELERVARREAPRHFLGGNRPLLTGARRL